MDRPLRVLHLITALSVGGVQHQLAKVVSTYDRGSFSAAVCCLSHPGQIGEELEGKGIPITVLGERGSGFHPRAFRRLLDLVRKERVEILRPHKYHSALYGVLVGRLAKVPVIVPSFHNPQALRKPRRRMMIRLLSLWSDRVVAVSCAVKENLTAGIGIPESKIRVIYNGADLRDYDDLLSPEEAKARIGIPSKTCVIGTVGRMNRRKGYPYLLQALPLLEKGGLFDYRVLLVGDGEARAGLERQVRSLGSGDKVMFTGTRRDIPHLLRAMDVFAFPSVSEGFGTSLVEAMAAEVPVIASDLPCVREIIPDERYGLLVPPQDPEALAGGILRTWRDETARGEKVAAARGRAREIFSLQQVVTSYQDLYREVLATKARGVMG